MTSFPLPERIINITPVLDRYGNPFSRGDNDKGTSLSESDRAKVLSGTPFSLLQWAHAMPGFAPDSLISHRGWGIARNMFINAAWQALSSVKHNSILFHPWSVQPLMELKGKDEAKYKLSVEAADFCKHLLSNIYAEDTDTLIDFRAPLFSIVSNGCHYGASVHEMETMRYVGGTYDGLIGLKYFAYKQPENVGYWLHRQTNRPLSLNIFKGTYNELDSKDPKGPWDWDLPLGKFVYYKYRDKDGLPYGWGDFRPGHASTTCIDLLTKLEMILNERFSGGFMKGTYSNPADGPTLLSAMNEIKRGASIALPEGLDVVIEQLTGNGIETVSNCLAAHKLQLAELLLGQSLTTSQGDRGSYAHAHVHQNTQEFFLAYVRQDIEYLVMSQIFARFLKANYGDKYSEVTPRFSLGVWNWQEIKLIADTLKTYVDMGALGAKAPFVRELPGFPPYDKEVEGELTIEPGRERVQVDGSGNPASPDTAKKPGTKAVRVSDLSPEDVVLVMPGE